MDTYVTYDDFIWWHESVASDPPDFGSPSHVNRHDSGEFVGHHDHNEPRAIEPEHPPSPYPMQADYEHVTITPMPCG